MKELLRDNQMLYETGFFKKGALELLNRAYNQALRELRPQMVALVELGDLEQEDSWNFSTIGNRYGDIYEAQLEVAASTRLNTGVPPPYFEKLIKPLLEGRSAKL